MTATSALRLLGVLNDRGVEASVGGGWAVDALLGEQTREHSDLDLWLPARDIEPLFVAFARCGLDRILPWPGDRPWNFVLHDGGTSRVDLHCYEPIDDERIHYGAFAGGDVFPASALAGEGVIAGVAVRCETAEWSVRWHCGYPARPSDRHDVGLLCSRFGLEFPVGFRDG
jgi:lincosamide nucleotidyltransferase A/C/D/E